MIWWWGCLLVIRNFSSLCLSRLLPPPVSPTLQGHCTFTKGPFVLFQPPPDRQMEGQSSHSHRAIFSQPSALVLLLTSALSSSFLSLRPGLWSDVHLACTHAVRCCNDSTQQVHVCVSDCRICFTMRLLMKPGQLSDPCPLFWPVI